MILLGSHFVFRGFAAHYKVQLPGGAAGTFHGRFVRGDQPQRPGRAPDRDDEEIPSLEELAEMLEGADG